MIRRTDTAEDRWLESTRLAPRIPWRKFVVEVFHWEQGDHVGIIAPTKWGKSTLLSELVKLRTYVVVLADKPHDSTMDRLIVENDFKRYESWPRDVKPRKVPRRVIWPDCTGLHSNPAIAAAFADALDHVYGEGSWTIAIDELNSVENDYNLSAEVKTFLMKGRSNGISVVVATQRPAFVSLAVYDQSAWLFLGRDSDARNVRRLSEIGTVNSEAIALLIPRLDLHQWLVINVHTGQMYRTTCPHPGPPPPPPRQSWWTR